jgi:hypothetical protein
LRNSTPNTGVQATALRLPIGVCTPGRRKLAVKVVDIFGNDTMTIVEVKI